MRQKELRIALVCYGGISLAVYMHGVTKELWKLACASRSFHADEPAPEDSQGVYRRLLDYLEATHWTPVKCAMHSALVSLFIIFHLDFYFYGTYW